ncbi:unnamed protein product [Allacma fusca]|uniref:Uncharacterized protein n=1 Tax=Allacma fusca TaxID=39272 RepID=A0A8J2JLR0_9HEXA|nr:unnamed protein product [Allacma fusca]
MFELPPAPELPPPVRPDNRPEIPPPAPCVPSRSPPSNPPFSPPNSALNVVGINFKRGSISIVAKMLNNGLIKL